MSEAFRQYPPIISKSFRRNKIGFSYQHEGTFGAILFNIFNYLLLLLIGSVTLFPFLYVFSTSISRMSAVADKAVWLFPIGFELKAYEMILNSDLIMRAYLNTIYYSLSGVLVALFMLVITAYPMSIKSFYGRRFVTILFTITMFFSGGLIPMYLVVKGCGMLNTVWALIVPNSISVFYLIIIRTNFQTIPASLMDSAYIDGANHLRILFSIILPLSTPIMATMFLFIIVSRWNDFFEPLIYIRDMMRQPIQVILRDILVRHLITGTDLANLQDAVWKEQYYQPGMAQALRAAAIIVSTGPILLVYPFIQRYFVKGLLIGSIKG